jgi:beta-glucosidase
VGYGLGFAAPRIAPIPLDETCEALTQDAGAAWFANGKLGAQVQALADNALLPDLRGRGNGIVATGVDRRAQEDARRIAFGPGARFTLSGPASGAGWRITYLVGSRPAGPVTVSAAGGKVLDITQGLSVAEGKGWREMVLTSACLGENAGSALTFTSEAPFAFQIAEVTRDAGAVSAECSF